MKKTMKNVKKLFFGLILATIGYLSYRFVVNPSRIYPLPYAKIKVSKEEIKKAQSADIIIIGDSAGSYLMDYMPRFVEETKSFLRKPIKIYDWSRPGENLAHVLAKVRALKKMPLLFIYHGGLDELTRRRFSTRDLSSILKNIKITKNQNILTAIYSLPLLSRIIYWPYQKVSLDVSAPSYPLNISSKGAIRILEVLYSIFKWEAILLTEHLKLKDAKAWFIPQSYNITEKPVRVCEATINIEIEKVLEKANALIKENKDKEALNIIQNVLDKNKGNALAMHTMGNLLLSRGEFLKAKSAYYQAMIHDCGLTRANPIFTKILMEEFEKKDFKIIDFNRMVTNYLGKNILFQEPRKPQSIYYNKLIDKMISEFRKFMN